MLTHLNCFINIMLLPSLVRCRLHKYLFGVNLLWLAIQFDENSTMTQTHSQLYTLQHNRKWGERRRKRVREIQIDVFDSHSSSGKGAEGSVTEMLLKETKMRQHNLSITLLLIGSNRTTLRHTLLVEMM